MIGKVLVFFRPPVSPGWLPTIVLVLKDGPVEWMLDIEHNCETPALQLLCECLAAAIPEWQGRMRHERGKHYLKNFRRKTIKHRPAPEGGMRA